MSRFAKRMAVILTLILFAQSVFIPIYGKERPALGHGEYSAETGEYQDEHPERLVRNLSPIAKFGIVFGSAAAITVAIVFITKNKYEFDEE